MQSLTLKGQSRHAIQQIIEGFHAPFTIKSLCRTLEESGTEISRATIYRALNALCDEEWMRLVILSDGRHVYARAEKGKALCIIECVNCGMLSSYDAGDFDRCFREEAARRQLLPVQMTTYMRARCEHARCNHCKEKHQ